MYMVGFAFRLRYEYNPSGFITTNRSYHVPMIWDFLKMRSQASAPSFCSVLYSCVLVLRSRGVNLISFVSNLMRSKRRKISSNLSFKTASLVLAVMANSSSIMTIRSLRLPLFSSIEYRCILMSLLQGMVLLLISNSFSSSTNSVSTFNFLSYNTTGQESCVTDGLRSIFPRDFLLSPFFGCLIYPISSSLLLSFQSDDDVPNSQRLRRINSFLRLSFILMYSSCCRLNSAYFSSSLSSPTKSSL